MRAASLGFRTDLRILEMSGSTIEDRGTHLVVRTPDNPTYFWGNFLLLAQAPVPGGEREVVGAFHTEFPEAEHVGIGIDGTGDATLTPEAGAAFEAAGLEIDLGVVLAADSLQQPRAVEADVRPLASDEDWEQRTRLARLLDPQVEEADLLPFIARRNAGERGLVEHGVLARYGAFVDGELVSTAGIVLTHAGWARFQSVETHPDHRRRGLAAAVVHAAGRHAVDHLGAERLIIVADEDGEAIGLYRRLGFADVERQLTLERRSEAWRP